MFEIVLPLSLAAVLVASGVAKLRTPDDLDGWAKLGVPRVFRKQAWLRIHPWLEVALASALALLGGVPGFVAALLSAALLACYLYLIVRTRKREPEASCACFGAQQRITAVTVARNSWLLLLAMASALTTWVNPIFGGALFAAISDWQHLAGWLIVALTVGLILWPSVSVSSESFESADEQVAERQDDDDELDYIRTRTPAVPVRLADGTLVNFRGIGLRKPALVLAVSSTCGGCMPVVDAIPEWRALLPELEIRRLITAGSDDPLTEITEPQSLHDPDNYVSASIADWRTPTAVLFGMDGMLAGGPVTGFNNIKRFVADIYESLSEAKQNAPSISQVD